MHRLGTARTCHPLCTLKSFTNIRIRKYERLAQLFVAYEDYIRPHFMLSDIQEFVRTNQMVFQRKGKAIPPEEIGGVEGALLTMDPRIKIYNGDVIEPSQDNSDKFEEYTLPEEGVFMPNQAFFLSTSDEYVEIPDGKVGFVKEAVAPAEARQMFLTRPAAYQPSPFFSHTNAPFIGSRSVFTGSITFENVMRMDSIILPGMPLSELYLIQATLPPENTQHSRYRGQEGATTGKFTE